MQADRKKHERAKKNNPERGRSRGEGEVSVLPYHLSSDRHHCIIESYLLQQDITTTLSGHSNPIRFIRKPPTVLYQMTIRRPNCMSIHASIRLKRSIQRLPREGFLRLRHPFQFSWRDYFAGPVNQSDRSGSMSEIE